MLDSIPEVVFSTDNIVALQRTYGNAFVQQMVKSSLESGRHERGCGCNVCGGGRIQRRMENLKNGVKKGHKLQRDVMSASDWKAQSSQDSSGKKIKGGRHPHILKIDSNIKRYHKRRGFPKHSFGLSALKAVIKSAQKYVSAKPKGKRTPSVIALRNQATTELPSVQEMANIQTRLSTEYGITLDNEAGIKAIKEQYDYWTTDKANLKGLTATRWKLTELRHVELALSRYAPILGSLRSQDLGKQTITSFSRLKAAANRTSSVGGERGDAYVEGENGTGKTTVGETFKQGKNVGMFDAADEVLDFASDPHNPTQEELDQGYIGTVIHELSHGLIETLPAPDDAPDMPDGESPSNMLEHFANTMGYWTSPYVKSGVATAEEPITDYAKTSAAEDMGETIMFFFGDPGKLQKNSMEHFNFVKDVLAPYLNPSAIEQATLDARTANPELNPPPIPAPAPAAQVDGVGGGITPESLQEGKENLKPTEEKTGVEEIMDSIEQGIQNSEPEPIDIDLDIDVEEIINQLFFEDDNEESKSEVS